MKTGAAQVRQAAAPPVQVSECWFHLDGENILLQALPRWPIVDSTSYTIHSRCFCA